LITETKLAQLALFGGDSHLVTGSFRKRRLKKKEESKIETKLTWRPKEKTCTYPHSMSDSDALFLFADKIL
jgi:hypothetical protein